MPSKKGKKQHIIPHELVFPGVYGSVEDEGETPKRRREPPKNAKRFTWESVRVR